MIIFYEGVPGSGKSYDAVVKIVANLKKRRKVYTNIDGLDDPKCLEMVKALTGIDDFDIDHYLHILTREQVYYFWDVIEPGSFVVIDEMQKFFNSRDWQKEENRKCADWCSTHRHEGYDALFLSQRIEKVDAQVRTLTEWTYRYKKVNFLGSMVNRSYVCFAYAGDDTGQPITKLVRRYDPKYFHCYKSYVTKDVKEQQIQTHANILRHPVFFAIPIVIIATLFFLVRAGKHHGFIGKAEAKTKNEIIIPAENAGLIPLDNEKKKEAVTPAIADIPVVPVVRNAPLVHRQKVISKNKIDEPYAVINGKKIGYCEGVICVE